MRWALTILGVLVVLAGVVWILQGMNVLPGSVMSGNPQWAVNGTIADIIGLGLIVFANWPRKKTPPSTK